MNTLLTAFVITAMTAPPVLAGQLQESTPRAVTSSAAPASGPNVVAAPAPSADADYRLGSGDKIRVEVYKEPQLSQSLQIRPDGKITLPLVGDMAASGLTTVQLRDQIGTALKEYVNNPVVTVMVVEAVASSVYVMGEVNKPGTIALLGPTTVLQALAMAGGLGQWAKGSKIRILRNGPTGVQTIKFNYDAAVKGDGPLLYLQRGDTVIVP